MLRIYTYRIPFKKPFKTAKDVFKHREGLIISYSENDITAFGEIAPLPGFSEENLDQVREVLIMNKEHLEQAFLNGDAEQTIRLLEQIHQFPSLGFGLDTLLHDLKAKKRQMSLPQLLFEEQNHTISVNAVLPIAEKDDSLRQASKLISKGFQTLKIKVGHNFGKEIDLLNDLRTQFPVLNIRIDANQAWTTEEAILNLRNMEHLNIEYCEQPVSANDLTSLKEVKDAVNIPIAADESVRNKNLAHEVIQNNAADLIIIKPMLMGTFKNISVTKELADTHNIKVVFTTSLETAVGRSAVTALATGLASKNLAQGLSTGSFFRSDIGHNHWLEGAIIRYPEGQGTGISVHLDTLNELN
ncbi:MAG: o-succinylbenzoate synthase [Gracilimonas sp.]|nr:o-succinylbenzoate synthase [Gracilimonas sp.]